MSIWGHRDSEPQAEEHQAEESAPAFWRAQGETPEVSGREPADAPPLAAHGQQASSDAAEPAVSESAAGTDAPVPVLTGEVVVLDAETAVKDPAPAGPGGDQVGVHDKDAVGPDMTEIRDPSMAGAHEPPVIDAQEPASEAQVPVAEAQEPMAGAFESATEAQEPTAAEVQEPAVAPAAFPDAATAQASPSGIPAQRWSEILVAFVDDPRGSVKMAADAVDEAIDEFVNSVRARQRALASTWQSAGAETEQLRTALRDYRKLGQRVQQLDLGEKTGA